MTQTEKILRHLNDYGSITSLEAINEYGILRLASRISDLKKLGFPIISEVEAVKNRYGESCHIKRYRLEGNHVTSVSQ